MASSFQKEKLGDKIIKDLISFEVLCQLLKKEESLKGKVNSFNDPG